MKAKKLYSLVMAIIIVFSSNVATVYANEKVENKKEIVFNENFTNKQLDNNTLFDMALKGDIVNNNNTQVSVSFQNNGKTKVVKVDKKLETTKFSNGEIIEHGSVTALFIQSIIEDTNYLTAAGFPGTKVETGRDGSITVQNIVGFDYDKMSVDGGVSYCYKITRIFSTPSLLDSTFTITKLDQFCHLSGSGYTAAGVPTVMTESDKSFSVSNPTSNTQYSISTGYVKYVQSNDGAGFGTTATLTYKRPNYSTTYTFPYSITLGA